jgi:hypothetical protein
MLSGHARKRLDLENPTQRMQLQRARQIFSKWVVSANDYPKEMAAQAVELLRREELEHSVLEARGDALLGLLREHRLGQLEGRIRGAFTLADVQSVVVPEDTPTGLIERLRSKQIPVEVQPRSSHFELRSLAAKVKSWLFVSPSEILNDEGNTPAPPPAPAPHLTPSQRRRARNANDASNVPTTGPLPTAAT